MSLDDALDAMGEYILVTEDIKKMLVFSLAIILSRKLSSDSLWGNIISVPSSGKTEVMNLIRYSPELIAVDKLTSKTLVSGYRDEDFEKKNNGQRKECSLARRLVGHTALTPDMTDILTSRQANEVLSQFRLLYDGKYAVEFGNDTHIEIIGRFNYIAGCTPSIDRITATVIDLGERWLFLRFPPHSLEAYYDISGSATKAAGLQKESKRREARLIVEELITKRRKVPNIDDNYRVGTIAPLAVFSAVMRTASTSDTEGAAPAFGESPARLAIAYTNLALGLCLVYGDREPSEAVTDMLKDVAFSTMPEIRRRVLSLFLKRPPGVCWEHLVEDLRMTEKRAGKILAELFDVGIVSRVKIPRGDEYHSWGLSDRAKEVIRRGGLEKVIKSYGC